MSQAAGSPEEDNLHPPSQPLELVEFQISLLRTLFGGDEWFLTEQQRKQHHPAFQRWKLCHLLKEQQGCFRFPEDRKLVPAFATLLLDNMAISQSSGGRLTSFSLGNFANYGYEKVRQRISKAIYEPTSFLSVMTEFGYAAWHLQEGHQITAFEDEGDVDFQITVPQLPLPILADTKRIGPDTGRNRYKKLVEKINNQIKSKKAKLGKDVYGLGVIDITNHVTQGAMCTSDATPKNVEGIRFIRLKRTWSYGAHRF